MSSGASAVGLSVMGEADYHGERLLDAVAGVLPGWRVSCKQHAGRLGACRLLVEVLDRLPGARRCRIAGRRSRRASGRRGRRAASDRSTITGATESGRW